MYISSIFINLWGLNFLFWGGGGVSIIIAKEKKALNVSLNVEAEALKLSLVSD